MSKELKNGIKVLGNPVRVKIYGSKQSKYCFDQ